MLQVLGMRFYVDYMLKQLAGVPQDFGFFSFAGQLSSFNFFQVLHFWGRGIQWGDQILSLEKYQTTPFSPMMRHLVSIWG